MLTVMAPGLSKFSVHIPALTILLLLIRTGNCCFTRLFCFGDSISDTGNFLESIGDGYHPVRNLPYGETYFGRATGRFSNGRIILDFIAEAYGLPFIPPYLLEKSDGDFHHGVNFAVGGATALNNSFFESKGIEPFWNDYSLDTQLRWFKELLPSLLEQPGCGKDIMSSSLFVVGEIGGNDYNHPLIHGTSLNEVKSFVPEVIRTISLTIHELIGLGAKTLLVLNNFPIGCVPLYLTLFQSQRKEDYDPETGCIKRLNEFSEYHNTMLSEELVKLQRLYADVTIIHVDYYEASMSIFGDPAKFGFTYPLMACCGGNGQYKYSALASCGNKGSRVCLDPSKYISWDGLHFTEATYKVIAHGVLQGTYSSPPISNTCSDIMHESASLLLPPTQCSG